MKVLDEKARPEKSHLEKANVEKADLEKARLFYKLADVKDRKYYFKTFRSAFVGQEMVDSLIGNGAVHSRKEAVALGRMLAERYDLFENCVPRNTLSFEDGSDKFYRFSTGALQIIGKISELESHEDEYSVPTTCTASISSASDNERTVHRPVLQRQNGKANIKSHKHWLETDIKSYGRKKHYVAQKSLFPHHTTVQGNDEDELTKEFSFSPEDITDNVIEWKNQLKEEMANKDSHSLLRQKSEVSFAWSVPSFDEAVEFDEATIAAFERSPLVRSPMDIRVNLQCEQSESSDIDSILKKESRNLLTMDRDDDRSTWTEDIITDEEDLKKYRLDEIKEKLQPDMMRPENAILEDEEYSYIESEGMDIEVNVDAETNCEDYTESQPSNDTRSVSEDDRSNTELTAFDISVGSSDTEEKGNHMRRESIQRTDNDTSAFHASSTIHDSTTGDSDDMTRITTDNALAHHSSQNAEKHFRPTSKMRIQTILYDELYSSDISVVQSAIEELRRIVIREPECRKQIVRFGGAKTIMETIKEFFEDEDIQYRCFVVVDLLASNEPDACKAFNEMEGIQCIVQSMQNHVGSNRIQKAGRLALSTVCRLHSPGVF